MKITDFADLIKNLPYREQAFIIRKEVWFPKDEEKRFKNQNDRIKKIFGDKDSIMISRHDLFNSVNELDLFIIKVLMWGYPTKGRGKNIEKIFDPVNFDQTIKKLEAIKQNEISNEEVQALFSEGLKLSTVSKLLYFLQIKVESYPALILDLRVIEAIAKKDGYTDDELNALKELSYENAPKLYPTYLKAISSLALKMNVKADQIEMFLFEFGSNLKEPKGDDGDCNLMND